MAEVEEHPYQTLSERVAALNKTQSVRDYNGQLQVAKRPPPPPPPTRPSSGFVRSKTVNNPPETSSTSAAKGYSDEPASKHSLSILPPPPIERELPCSRTKADRPKPESFKRQSMLAPQHTNQKISPVLPPRQAQGRQCLDRKLSESSITSINSSVSVFSSRTNSSISSKSSVDTTRRLAPSYDPANLPKLPPSRKELAAQEQSLKDAEEAERDRTRANERSKLHESPKPDGHAVQYGHTGSERSAPIVPSRTKTAPMLPSRSLPQEFVVPSEKANLKHPTLPARRLPPATIPKLPTRSVVVLQDSVPPPIHISSKPSCGSVSHARSIDFLTSHAPPSCLICRDFSGPDNIAKQFPRQTLSANPIKYLANVLCSPFPSLADKARAIFTWLHHNIDYDTEAFFVRTVKHATPESSIERGLAVCGGYAGVYSAIALHAGLECVMITGHGKGYGFTAMRPGESCPPPNPTGHAWNAVRIDNGEWKLLDSCWGAGHVDNKVYCRNFREDHFTSSNEDFGISHFPSDRNQFFRADGRALSWDEYIVGSRGVEGPQIYGPASSYGIASTSFLPLAKKIQVRNPMEPYTRFQFTKKCTHWDFERNGTDPGKPYLLILQINGVSGDERDFEVLDFDDYFWYVDVETRRLGIPGQDVQILSVRSIGDDQNPRGLMKGEFLSAKGRKGMGFAGVARWELA